MAAYNKICTITLVRVPCVNRGRYTWKWVDTPESWHTVCPVFGMGCKVFEFNKAIVMSRPP